MECDDSSKFGSSGIVCGNIAGNSIESNQIKIEFKHKITSESVCN